MSGKGRLLDGKQILLETHIIVTASGCNTTGSSGVIAELLFKGKQISLGTHITVTPHHTCCDPLTDLNLELDALLQQ